MRRRARETFVLGAERVFDDAELDLRNEAEADHEPTIELDHTAPVEPAIAPPQSPAGLSAGAGVLRGRPSGFGRTPWRPRPSVRALAVASVVAGAVAIAVLRGGGEHEASQRALVDSSAEVDGRAPAHAPGEGLRPLDDQRGYPASPGRDDRPTEAVADESPPRRSSAPVAAHALPAADPEMLPVSAAPAPPAAPSSSTQEPVASSEPVQSAASVRGEFGP